MVHSIDNHKSSVASTTSTNTNSSNQNQLHHRYPSTGCTNHRTTNTNPNTISSHKSSIVSYGSITEMSTLQEEPLLVATTTATTTTPTLSNQNQNHHHHHHHRRRSTNTDIASIFQNFSIPNMFLSRNSITSNVVAAAAATTTTTATTVPSESNHSVLSYNITNIIVDNDEEDNEYPTPLLLLPTTTTTTTNHIDTMTSCRHWMKRFCCFSNDSNTRRNHSDNHDTTPISMAPGAILNLCSATLGAGILALPYTLLQSGFIYGTLMLFVAAIATERSIYILISVIHHSNCNSNNNNPMTHTNNSTNHCNSYESLTENVLDKPSSSSTISTRKYTTISYRRTIEIAMLFFCCGCAIGYIMAIMDILEQFHLLFIYNSRQYTIIVVWLVAMVPLSLLQNVQSLQYASAIGIMAIGTLIVAAFVHYIQHSQPQHDGLLSSSTSSDASNVTVLLKLLSHWRNILNGTSSNMENNDHVSLMDFLWPINGWVSILTSGPVVLFAFSCQPNVCSIYDELVVSNDHDDNDNQRPSDNVAAGMNDRASTKKLHLMHRVTIVAVCICAMLYCSISVIALADFGKNVQPNILSCYSHDDTGTNGGSGSSSTLTQIATAAMALAIVMAFPLNIFPARVTLIGLWHNYCQQRQLAAVTAASSNNSLDRSISLHGIVQPHEGLTAALLDGEVTNTENVSSHRSLVSSPLTNGNYHEIEIPENSQAAITNVSDNHPPFNRTVHVVSTLFLTTSTLLLALILPNISVVFGLLGGTASSWLGFCVPGLLGIQLSKNERSSGQPSRYGLLLTSWALLIGGVIVGVLTTGVTIYNTMKH